MSRDASELRPAERTGIGVWLYIAALVLIGLFLRTINIGELGLVSDEGHQALAVEAILEHGVPRVSSGNIYLRGAPFLYAEAAVSAVTGVNEWSLRFPAAVFGALCTLATFLLARRLFGLEVAVVAATLMAFSIWGFELSRYARMYTLLQFCFIMSGYAFLRGVIDDDGRWRVGMWFFMLAAICTHQLGVMTLLLFLVPAFLPDDTLPERVRGNRRYALALPPMVMGVIWMLYHRQIGAWMVRSTRSAAETDNDLAPGILGMIEGYVRVPEMTMPLNLLSSDRTAVFVALVLYSLLAITILAVALRQPGRRLRAGMALAITTCAALNLFSVAIGLAFVSMILFSGGLREFVRAPWGVAWFAIAAFGAYWTIYLLNHPAALDPGWDEPWSIVRVFTGYPPFYSRVLEWFIDGWPRMTSLVGVGLAGLVFCYVADRRRSHALIAVALVVLPLVAVTFGRELFNEVRYHYHIYAFIVIVFAVVITVLARMITAALDIVLAALGKPFPTRRVVEGLTIGALALGCSRDVSPGDLTSLLERDYTTSKDPIRATLNWEPYASFHQDHSNPARYVQDHYEAGDVVMFFGPTYWASIYDFYIDTIDYAIAERASRLYHDNHVVHHVTGVRCLVSVEELNEVLEQERSKRIWLLGDLNLLAEDSSHFSTPMKERLRELARPWHYLGRDNNTLVRRIDPGPTDRADFSGLGESR